MMARTTASGLTPASAAGWGRRTARTTSAPETVAAASAAMVGAGLLEIGVGKAGALARAGLHHDFGPEGYEFLDGFRRRRDARFIGGGLSGNGNAHE